MEKVSGHEYGYGTPGCVPIFCLGMQISVIEFARSVSNLPFKYVFPFDIHQAIYLL